MAQKKNNRYNFVVFKNYNGTFEAKVIPRETYLRLMAAWKKDK